MITATAKFLLLASLTCVPLRESPGGEPGVRVEFTLTSRAAPANAGPHDARLARLLALRVDAGEPPTPFLPPGPFRAVFRSLLEVEFFDDYTFYLEGNGRARLEIDGEPVLEASGDLSMAEPRTVELEEGLRSVVLEFESAPDGSGDVRLEWSSFDLARGPISPARLRRVPDDDPLRRALALRRGRELVAERQCLSCHVLPVEQREALAMPELDRRAPVLAAVGGALRPGWISRWLLSPRSERAEATMPRTLRGTQDEQESDAADLAAFLAGSAEDSAELAAPTPQGDPRAGEELFARIGCVACHRLGDEQGDAERAPERVSLEHVAAKWKPGALARFLRAPAEHRPVTRMPSLNLSAAEADHLVAYLLQATSPPASASQARSTSAEGDAARGRELLETSGCLGCHDAGRDDLTNRGAAPDFAAVRASSLRAGCLAAEPEARGAAPDFLFAAGELEALRLFLAHEDGSLRRRVAAEYAERQIVRLRCGACHTRDGQPDTWTELDAVSGDRGGELERAATEAPPPRDVSVEEAGAGTLVQERPLLTWTGEKLRPSWLARFLADPFAHAARPWLDARMPRFELDAELLARGLAASHGVSSEEEPPVVDEAVDSEIGAKLIATEGGLACETCHDLAGAPATAAFEARGVDLVLVPVRLRKEYYLRWMLDPQSVWPGTKMPQFATDGVSPLVEFYDGDGLRQFEAIWKHLVERSTTHPPPSAAEASGSERQ